MNQVMKQRIIAGFVLASLFCDTVNSFTSDGASHPHWTYDQQEKWGKNFPTCNGREQSPVDISSARKLFDPALLGKVRLGPAYYVPFMFKLENTGHSAQLTVRNDYEPFKPRPTLEIGPETYKFEQLHFHWGPDDSDGSEHAIFGRKFPLEMHLVHYNSRYRNFNDALGKPGGVVVLAVMFEVSHRANYFYQPIIRHLSKITDNGQVVENMGRPIILSSLFPDLGLIDVALYRGSLTTPPCTENIIWVVSTRIGSLSARQLKQFRKLCDDRGKPLDFNFRDFQKLRNRVVLKSF